MTRKSESWRHVEGRTWDSGNPEAVDGWITWCKECGARPWPCDAERMRLRAIEAETRLVGLDGAVIEGMLVEAATDGGNGAAVIELADALAILSRLAPQHDHDWRTGFAHELGVGEDEPGLVVTMCIGCQAVLMTTRSGSDS